MATKELAQDKIKEAEHSIAVINNLRSSNIEGISKLERRIKSEINFLNKVSNMSFKLT